MVRHATTSLSYRGYTFVHPLTAVDPMNTISAHHYIQLRAKRRKIRGVCAAVAGGVMDKLSSSLTHPGQKLCFPEWKWVAYQLMSM
jgi:hypothetical protein